MILTKLKNILKQLYIKYIDLVLLRSHKNKYENKKLFWKNYTVLKNTLKSTSDYDDAWLLYLSQEAKIVFDVGCHTGKSALLIACSKSLEKLVLVDPNPLSLSLAAENLIINNLSQNAIFLPKAAHSTSGELMKLWTMKNAFAGASTDINFTRTGSITGSYFNVKTVTLDDISTKYNLYPDLVKIDVEGVESSVLEGTTHIAKRGKTIFIVEVHSCKKMDIVQNTDKILHWCKDNEYKAYYLCKHTEISESSIISKRGRYHLLLIHKNAKYPVGLNKIKQSQDVGTLFIET